MRQFVWIHPGGALLVYAENWDKAFKKAMRYRIRQQRHLFKTWFGAARDSIELFHENDTLAEIYGEVR